MHLIEVEDIHVVSTTPQIVDVTLGDGFVFETGGECHRCEEWPTTVVIVPRLDAEGTEVDLIHVCRECIMRLTSDDYNAHKELDAAGEGH